MDTHHQDNFETKVWGSVRHLFDGPVSVSVLRVEAGAYCSTHYHRHRFNHFLVVSGALDVVIFNEKLEEIKRVRVPAKSSFAVSTEVIHRFEVIESGHVVETYWTKDGQDTRLDDIARLAEGGKFQ
jgi:mannose-6-phosphate isomerase-like protein (cupin superfamily)